MNITINTSGTRGDVEPYIPINKLSLETLARIGFEFQQSYETPPGWLNFPQPVNRWLLTRERWFEIKD